MQILPDRSEFGFGSAEWILKHAIPHAPQENKDNTLISLVTFLLHSESNYTAHDVVDLITQGILTGRYVQTVDYRKMFEPESTEPDDLYPENDNPANSLKPITDEEVDRFSRRMDEVLGDNDGNEGRDPFEGWKIDE